MTDSSLLLTNHLTGINGYFIRSSDQNARQDMLATALSLQGAKFIIFCTTIDLEVFFRKSEDFFAGLRAGKSSSVTFQEVQGDVLYGLPWVSLVNDLR